MPQHSTRSIIRLEIYKLQKFGRAQRIRRKNPMHALTFSRESASRMLAYWADEGFGWMISPTADFFAENIRTGNFEFWTAQTDGKIAGELYLAKNLPDRDFADGEGRCYLCAFRVTPLMRGQGIGSALLSLVLARAAGLGFREASIGVVETQMQNLRLYRRFGFAQAIKQARFDPCNILPDGRPCQDHFLLLCRPLDDKPISEGDLS